MTPPTVEQGDLAVRKRCGCREGRAVGALYILAMPLLFLLTPLSVTELWSWGIAFAGLFCAALAGKVIGLARGYVRDSQL